MMIAGLANPHAALYVNGAGRDTRLLDVIAVSDFDNARLEQAKIRAGEAANNISFHNDYIEMFDAHPDADAVMIGSDNIEHFAMFKEAVRRKLHIYMMKVISMDEDECRQMIEIEKTYDRVIAVELELHFNAQFAQAKKLIDSGKIGEIKSIYLTNISQSPCNYYKNWGDPLLSYGKRIPIRKGENTWRGGAITDHPHPYDIVRWLTGAEFKTVSAVSAVNQRAHLAVEDHAAITGELTNGVKYFINPSYSNLEERCEVRRLYWPKSLECNLKVTGTKGYVSADFFDRHSYLLGPGFPSPNRMLVDGVPRMDGGLDDSLVGSFVAAIEGRRAKPETVLADSYAAVRVMNAAYDSIYYGKTITLEEEKL